MGSKKRVQLWYSYTFITLLLLILSILVLICGRDRFKKVDLSKEKVIPKQKVLLRPSTLTRKSSSEYKHIMYDGVVQSKKLEQTNDLLDQDAVWIVDPLAYNCEKELIPEIKKRLEKIPTPWKLIFLDFSDMGRDYGPCFYEIKNSLFKSGKYTFFARRAFYSEERNIHFDASDNEKTNFHDLGEYINWDSYFVEDDSQEKLLGGLVQPLRYSLRSDFADAIFNITSTMGITYLPDKYRRHGAIHFWNVKVDYDDPNKSSTLRNMVTAAMLELAEENDMKSKGIHAYQVGTRENTGRQNVQEGYLKTMLSHKIVVVSQRDFWEDHCEFFYMTHFLFIHSIVLIASFLSCYNRPSDGSTGIRCACID